MIAFKYINRGKTRDGFERCVFTMNSDGNFPEGNRMAASAEQSTDELARWKERFLRGEKVEDLESGYPDCCLPLRELRK